ncbi:hypothetical protein [Kibdelosporangium philippinense]|uniref:hypothetical protein n=1 Tax=Kibdelosporangium philippinense TaxID=211113 RepID=UPI003612E9D2
MTAQKSSSTVPGALTTSLKFSSVSSTVANAISFYSDPHQHNTTTARNVPQTSATTQ